MIEHKGEDELLSGEFFLQGRLLLQALSAPGGSPPGFANLYSRTKSGVSELFYKNDLGAERDLSDIATALAWRCTFFARLLNR